MAVTVKKIALWRAEVDNEPGALARILEPLAGAGADLQVVMGYGIPGNSDKAVIEVFPVKGKKAIGAAQAAGLKAAAASTLLVEGDDRPGLGHGFAKAMADAGINIGFVVAQALGRKFTAVFGFHGEADAGKAAALIKKAAAAKKPTAKKKAAPTRKPAAKKPAAKKSK